MPESNATTQDMPGSRTAAMFLRVVGEQIGADGTSHLEPKEIRQITSELAALPAGRAQTSLQTSAAAADSPGQPELQHHEPQQVSGFVRDEQPQVTSVRDMMYGMANVLNVNEKKHD